MLEVALTTQDGWVFFHRASLGDISKVCWNSRTCPKNDLIWYVIILWYDMIWNVKVWHDLMWYDTSWAPCTQGTGVFAILDEECARGSENRMVETETNVLNCGLRFEFLNWKSYFQPFALHFCISALPSSVTTTTNNWSFWWLFVETMVPFGA